jgi:hypothetical protein
MAEKSVVRELVTLLGWDVDERKLGEYEGRVESLKKNLRRLAIAAGLTGAAITAIAVKTARQGDELVKTGQRLGLSIQKLQEWRFIAQRSRVEAATFDMAIQRFGRRFAEASRGTGEAVQALARMRVATRDQTGQIRDLDEALTETLMVLQKWPNEQERNALAMKLFDSEGVRLVQIAEQGEEGIAKLRDRFRELGGALSEEGARRAVEANDAWTDFTTSLNGLVFDMGTELLPAITNFLSVITEWIVKNRTLVTVIGWLTIGLGGLTTAVLTIVVVWKAWGVAIAFVNIGIALTIAKVAALVALFGVFILLGEDIGTFLSGTGDSVTGRAVNGLKKLGTSLLDSAKQQIHRNGYVRTDPQSLGSVRQLHAQQHQGIDQRCSAARSDVIPQEHCRTNRDGITGYVRGRGEQGATWIFGATVRRYSSRRGSPRKDFAGRQHHSQSNGRRNRARRDTRCRIRIARRRRCRSVEWASTMSVKLFRSVESSLVEIIVLDATLSHSISRTSTVTQYPIESGSKISDHKQNDPEEVVVEGFVSNTPVTLLASGVLAQQDDTRSKTAYDALVQVFDNKDVVQVQSELEVFDDMLLQSLDVPRDRTNFNALQFTASFKKVRQIGTRVVTLKDDVEKLAKPEEDLGKQNSNDASAEEESQSSLLLQALQGIGVLQ